MRFQCTPLYSRIFARSMRKTQKDVNALSKSTLRYVISFYGGNNGKRNFKTLDVTNLIKFSNKKHMKFNMLLDYCIGKAAVSIKEFYILPVGDKLIQYDTIAVNMIVKNKDGEVNSCDILYAEDLDVYNKQYLKYTSQAAANCQDIDLSKRKLKV